MKRNSIKTYSIGGSGVFMKGNIHAEVPISIASSLEGDITCEDLVEVCNGANIKGNIKAATICIASGTITGDIEASKIVILQKDSIVIGNIKTPVISIDEGAIFNGQCYTKKEEVK